MLNFTVGPVMMSEDIKRIGGEDIPYFRTEEFSKVMLENKDYVLEAFHAPKNSDVVFLTTSGTGAMEASMMNVINEEDKVLVVNGGSFGQRFVDICDIHHFNYEAIKLEAGKALKKESLEQYEGQGFTVLCVQACETSTGVKFDLDMIGEFCKKNNILLIVDAISGFLADHISMEEMNIDVMFTGSQKGLAVAPGIAVICLNERAIKRTYEVNVPSLYFNFISYFKNMERGQTPFTPAVGILLQLNARLKEIHETGIENCVKHTQELANYFRSEIKGLPFELFPEDPSYCCTALKVLGKQSAHKIFEIIKDEYHIFICPNGGEFKDSIFRVGHIGSVKKEDYDQLISVFMDMKKRDLL